jgi:hypothetical protein
MVTPAKEKAGPVDPGNQSQAIIFTIFKDLFESLQECHTCYESRHAATRILASFKGEPDYLLSKVAMHHKDRKERIAVSHVQSSEVGILD